MSEPTELTAALTDLIARHPSGSRLHTLGRTLLRAHSTNQERRAAVLRYPDLAAQLTKPPLDYTSPERWNGYIPPAMDPDDDGGMCRTASLGHNGEITYRFNQLGHRSRGPQVNDSPARAALLEISAEAWNRDHPPLDLADQESESDRSEPTGHEPPIVGH